ncbi:CaiB/BaiF CoA-transferase family protein [Pseudarthrobacter sp. fls2-241-R2A-168]|uniref:CaiB/BaiF CoA transferase family protein n=1 Tax=Pseudarthrobacter sp. fls2-241-R2A-168 TaxID=3040304 RepID=UPI00255743AC|nr:CaiB/BaiF CoA-transferase family protein [Pseudarthrobacter sp. fls2-241-R2A-168]
MEQTKLAPAPESPKASALPKPLEDVVVLDVTLALSGPYATLLLAGLGARVIKVENPEGGDAARENSPYYGRDGVNLGRQHPDDVSLAALSRLRNKEAVTLNLKCPEGQAIFRQLAAKADVLVQNFSFGTMEKLGLGYDVIREINPRIVYCSISGFGSEITPGGGKAMDSIIQGMSGAMLSTGEPGDPPVRIGFPIADLAAPLFGVIGILSALHQARRTGIGQHVDVSMLGALTSLVAVEPWATMEALNIPTRTGSSMPRLAPFGNYRTLDGFVVICAPLDAFSRGLFSAMGQSELISDTRFASRDDRVRNSRELDALIERWTSSMSTADAITALQAASVPAGEVRTPKTAVSDPVTVRRGETAPLTHPLYPNGDPVYGPGVPIVFSGATVGFDQAPPQLGAHTEAVLTELLGLSSAEISTLRGRGAI